MRTFAPTVRTDGRHTDALCPVDSKLGTIGRRLGTIGGKLGTVGDVWTVERAGDGRADTESVG
ncbi:hypothetical protein [Gordonia sp. SL306]|uniref:hypothetical protein n=1 Tax=Gordonia sp. SL306 TaxID=2995145 RepID=UPI0022710FAF|nr:hypothetical protein [Gordonia sp. SL306]WAC54324.1 hypothetical protein OVA31_16775 [Gordonia sp. SL306]